MQPDTTKVWSPAEVRAAVGKIVVESLGVDEAAVTDRAALVRDLGAESIDFLDMSFKCQQAFGVDLPIRLIQERRVEWRDLGVLARVLAARYGLAVTGEELRTVAPATIAAVLDHLAARHGFRRTEDDAREVAEALARQMLADLDGTGLDLSDLTVERFSGYLAQNLHAPDAADEVMNRFTVRAVTDYIAGGLAAAGRLAPGT